MNVKKTEYIIRPVREIDIKNIVELERACFSFPMSEGNVEKFLLGDSGIAFVCYEGKNEEKLCAYCGAICVLDEAQVLNVATAPDRRRQGYGKMVTQTLIEAVKNKGITDMTLEVRESNFAAQSLYKGLGFYEIGRIKNYYAKPTEDALILKLDIQNKE